MDLRLSYDRHYAELGKKTAALYLALREAIVDGTLAEGERLPSSRRLAELYGVSRGAVGEAYDMLLAEGFVRARTGSGTFVAYRAAGSRATESDGKRSPAAAIELTDWAKRLERNDGLDGPPGRLERNDGPGGPSKRLERNDGLGEPPRRLEWNDGLDEPPRRTERNDGPDEPPRRTERNDGVGGPPRRQEAPGVAPGTEGTRRSGPTAGHFAAGSHGPDEIDFRIGLVDPGLFPVEEWKTAMYAEFREMMGQWHHPPAVPEGHLPLREAIARELRRERGIKADASRLVLTSGSVQAIALLTLLLIAPGTAVVLENPGYAGTRKAVMAAGGRIIAAPVDDGGIMPADWPAKLLFVTPTRHFPSGAVLAPDRKTALLEWASRRGAVIVEDDYDSELRWGGRPSEPLKALDAEDRVVYVGTFSKTMYTGIRIGYALLPESLALPFRRAKALLEPRPSGLAEQRALAGFMAGGGYARHLRRMRRVCGRRLLALREQLETRLHRVFRLVPTDAGLHLYARWLGGADEYERFAAACSAAGVRWSDGESAWIGEPACHSALLGFGHLPEERIALGVARMEAAMRSIHS